MPGYVFTTQDDGVDVEVDLSSQVLECEAAEEEPYRALHAARNQQRTSGSIEPYL